MRVSFSWKKMFSLTFSTSNGYTIIIMCLPTRKQRSHTLRWSFSVNNKHSNSLRDESVLERIIFTFFSLLCSNKFFFVLHPLFPKRERSNPIHWKNLLLDAWTEWRDIIYIYIVGGGHQSLSQRCGSHLQWREPSPSSFISFAKNFFVPTKLLKLIVLVVMRAHEIRFFLPCVT